MPEATFIKEEKKIARSLLKLPNFFLLMVVCLHSVTPVTSFISQVKTF